MTFSNAGISMMMMANPFSSSWKRREGGPLFAALFVFSRTFARATFVLPQKKTDFEPKLHAVVDKIL